MFHLHPKLVLRAREGARRIYIARKDRDKNRGDIGVNRLNDEIRGKIGEEAVCYYTKIGTPDYSIVEKPEHDLDLPRMSVKTCDPEVFEKYGKPNRRGFDTNNKRGKSFLIPIREIVPYEIIENDEVVETTLFEDDIRFAFAEATLFGKYNIFGWLTVGELRSIWSSIVKKPYKPEITTKMAVYLEDIQHLLKPIESVYLS